MFRFPSFRPNPASHQTAHESLLDILYRSDQCRRYTPSGKSRMPSSKGKPTDPQLREEVKEEVKQESKGKYVWSNGQTSLTARQAVEPAAGRHGKPRRWHADMNRRVVTTKTPGRTRTRPKREHRKRNRVIQKRLRRKRNNKVAAVE